MTVSSTQPKNHEVNQSIPGVLESLSYANVVVTRPRYGLRGSELHFWPLKMERNSRQPARRDLGEAN